MSSVFAIIALHAHTYTSVQKCVYLCVPDWHKARKVFNYLHATAPFPSR